ncbi:MAG: TRAP transporter small permease [Alphaproteobacteria bacterium]|nr:TRAP transporter small permease [Alphaproteobacteria bacterium]
MTIRRWYDRIIIALVFVSFSVMLGAALIGTLARYLTFLPVITWGEEVTRFAGIWSVFLVSGLSIRRGAHLGVDMFTRLMTPKIQRLVALAVFLMVLGFVLILLVYGIVLSADNLAQISPALEWRMGLVYLCIPIGAALMSFELVIVIIHVLRRGMPPPPPADASPA